MVWRFDMACGRGIELKGDRGGLMGVVSRRLIGNSGALDF